MEQQGNYGYSTGGYTISGLQRIENKSGELRDGWRPKPSKRRNFVKFTPEEKLQIKRSYQESGMSRKDFAASIGISYNALFHILYHAKYVKNVRRGKWTDEMLEELKEIYSDVPNKEIGEKFGVSTNGVAKKAMELGLKKSAEYVNKQRETCWANAHTKEAHAKHSQSYKATIEREKRRLRLGMEQQTAIRVERANRSVYGCRHKLKKAGYIVPWYDLYNVYYDENTQRTKRREDFAKKVGIEIKPYGEEKDNHGNTHTHAE